MGQSVYCLPLNHGTCAVIRKRENYPHSYTPKRLLAKDFRKHLLKCLLHKDFSVVILHLPELYLFVETVKILISTALQHFF